MLDTSTDFAAIADGLETVTLRRRGADTGVVIDQALRRAATAREAAPSQGASLAVDVTWHLPGNAERPEIGGAIVDSTQVAWTILSVAVESLGGRWRCGCRNLALAAGLGERVNIQRATWTKDSGGAPVATWRDELVNVAARIQPLAAHVRVEHERRGVAVTHTIFLAEPIACDDSTRIVHGAAIHRPLTLEHAERIDVPVTVLTRLET